MSLVNLWKPSVIVTPGGQINQITAGSVDPGIGLSLLRGDAKLSPQFAAVSGQKPTANFTSTAIKRVLDILGTTGVGYSAATYLYLAKKVLGGGLAVGANHARITAPRCLIVPRTLRASQGQEATIDCDIHMISADGVAPAIAWTVSQSLPSLAMTDQAWTLGPATINGYPLLSLASMEITFGIGEKVIAAGGDIWPTFCCIDTIVSSVKLSTYDPTILATGLSGAAQGNYPSSVWLRAKANGGGNVLDAVASHIRFDMTSRGIITCGSVSGGDDGEVMAEVNFQPIDDGTNALLVLNTASVIA